jgi:hypothetical protein
VTAEVLDGRLDACGNLVLVVTRAILGQQELKHEGRHIGAFLDLLHQVFADHSTRIDLIEFDIERIHK